MNAPVASRSLVYKCYLCEAVFVTWIVCVWRREWGEGKEAVIRREGRLERGNRAFHCNENGNAGCSCVTQCSMQQSHIKISYLCVCVCVGEH